jgi:formate hydrogenlyase subunit 4
VIEWLALIAAPFAAVLLDGAYRVVVARMQNRQGPPLLQTFYDLEKLWRKKSLPLQADPFFRAAPLLHFLATYALFLFVPLAVVAFDYDFIFLIYLTILSMAFYVLAGVSSDSPYSILSSMREMSLMICYEVTLTLAIFTFMLASKSVSLAALTGTPLLLAPLAAIALAAVVLAETHTAPFDTATAPTEVLAAAETEYPAKGLFFVELARQMRRLFYALFVPLLLFGNNLVLTLGGAAAVYLLLAYARATNARYRVDQAWWVLFAALLIAIAEFVRISWSVVV